VVDAMEGVGVVLLLGCCWCWKDFVRVWWRGRLSFEGRLEEDGEGGLLVMLRFWDGGERIGRPAREGEALSEDM